MRINFNRNSIDIWYVYLNQNQKYLDFFVNHLSEYEKVRVQKYFFQADRNSFIIRRGILRLLVSYYLGTEPSSVRFDYGTFGKPIISKRDNNKNSLCFNLSYSRNIAIYGFRYRKKIGVDIEFIRPVNDAEEIVKNFFSPREYKDYMKVPLGEKKEVFLNGWTRKEAFIKATGKGLNQSLSAFEVPLCSIESANISFPKICEKKTNKWILKEINVDRNYKIAMATEGPIEKINLYEWNKNLCN